MSKREGLASENEDLWTFVGIIILVVMFWFMAHEHITKLLLWIRTVEITALSIVSDNSRQWSEYLATIDGKSLNFSQFALIASKTGEMVKWVFLPMIIALGIGVYFYQPRSKFRKIHTIESLAEQEQILWPEISPTIGLDLCAQDIRKGPWAAAATEHEFAKMHKLILPSEKKNGHGKPITEVNRQAARKVFVKQLGPLWRGPDALPPYAKALYAALIMRIDEDVSGATEKFRLLAKTYSESKSVKSMDTSWVDEAIHKHGKNKLVQRAIHQHAYVRTLFPMLLKISRRHGVMASAMFIWLKPTDRTLWYAMNNTGMDTSAGGAFHAECAGIMSHYQAEKTLGKKILFPVVDYAIDGLQKAVNEFCEDDSLEKLYK